MTNPAQSSPSLLNRLCRAVFGSGSDPVETVRPLWHRVVEIARETPWYATHGVADTLGGRFDAITMVLSAVLVRMEADDALKTPSVLLTELFVTDMDGQLRESGVGDMVVGKHMGRLMSTLGGRLGAYRDGLAACDDTALTAAVLRNVSLNEGADPAALALALRQLARDLDATGADALLAGSIAR
ncbi:hypothetical protein GTZ99_12170 [Novosphingobium sp. FSY-8]|uniref:Ubiquinol-cytochrome c chaperone domain-containing protein n=1 Tax=Novosphingobium ovatum TaxID=1908523 RepID=A0ABW9XFK0_9SPHN|nr:ubiquinol-cytochrome C chaperone family protein [Novosphingobium ovatum]NBC37311.1 hypothetical protein [Novosphingobium ovatum]